MLTHYQIFEKLIIDNSHQAVNDNFGYFIKLPNHQRLALLQLCALNNNTISFEKLYNRTPVSEDFNQNLVNSMLYKHDINSNSLECVYKNLKTAFSVKRLDLLVMSNNIHHLEWCIKKNIIKNDEWEDILFYAVVQPEMLQPVMALSLKAELPAPSFIKPLYNCYKTSLKTTTLEVLNIIKAHSNTIFSQLEDVCNNMNNERLVKALNNTTHVNSVIGTMVYSVSYEEDFQSFMKTCFVESKHQYLQTTLEKKEATVIKSNKI